MTREALTGLDGPIKSAFRYPEGIHGPASLMHAGPIPLLRVSGTPEEIAAQVVALALRPAARLLDYPLDLLANHFRSRFIARLAVRPLDCLGNRLLSQFPPSHHRVLSATAGLMGDARRVLRANTLLDLKNTPPWRLFGTPVSTPLRWSEVRPTLDPKRFNLRTAPSRFARQFARQRDDLGEREVGLALAFIVGSAW